MMNRPILFFTLLVFTRAVFAVETVTLSSQDHFPAPRWIYGIGEFPKTGLDATTLALAKVKQAQAQGNDAACAENARAAKPRAKGLQAWLSTVELECATRVKPSLKSSGALSRAIEDAAKNKDWFALGPQTSRLRTAFATALTSLIDQDLKVNRARAWKSIERVDEFSNVLDLSTRAQAWRAAGDLSVVQTKPDAAREFYKRSLALMESSDARDRLRTVEAALGLQKKSAEPSPTPSDDSVTTTPTVTPINEASVEELDLAARATAALKSGDLVVAMDDAIKIIKSYPGGTRAKWASDRVQETLNSFADRTDIKYQDIHDQILSRAEQADADRQITWASVLYNRAQFADAFRLSKKALGAIDGAKRTRALELVGESALAVEAWDVARSSFQEQIEKSAGQPASREALFRLGLLDYREQKFSEAIAEFERLLALPQTENLEVGARYWLWRSLQKSKSDRAGKVAEELMTKFPFSYYGLRARIEQGGGSLDWKLDDNSKVESTMVLTPSEKLAWEKVQILLKAGWLDEAQSEIRELPLPVKAEDKAVRALLYAAAAGYLSASKLANEAWDEKSEFRRAPFTGAVFPKDFARVHRSAKQAPQSRCESRARIN